MNPFSSYNSKKYKAEGRGRPSMDWEEGAFDNGEDNVDDYYEGHSNSHRYWIISLFTFAMFFFLFARIFFLQVIKTGYYKVLAEGNHIRSQAILAPRGIIYDSQGEALVQNIPNFELDLSTIDLPKDYATEVQNLSSLFKVDPSVIENAIKAVPTNTFQEYTVIPSLDKNAVVVFESKINDFPGFSVENDPVRQYVDPDIFAHPIGYTGKINADELLKNPDYLLNDYIGKSGLESSYEKYLRGTNGQHQTEVDANGNMQADLGDVQPQPGNNLYLNIDAGLQRFLYQDIIAKNGNKKAAAVAVDPRTGQILALVSVPGFNSNLFSAGISQQDYSKLSNDPTQPLFNRVISGVYPPGSTIKPVLASAVLQENVISPTAKIDDNGDLVVGAFHFHGWKAGGLGMMDMRTAIAMSSDIYFYTVGGGQTKLGITGLGITKIAKYYALFGMGQKLGIDVPGEAAGLIGSPEERVKRFSDPASQAWYLGDTYHESIGQGDMEVTPLQDAMWIATVANGGTLYQPYVVDKVEGQNGNVILQNKLTVIRSGFIDPKNIAVVQEGMRQTVTSGTATALKSLPVTSAGKTGTAQFDSAVPGSTHAWFVAYAPYENPQIVIDVLIEAGGEGNAAAEPVVKDALNWWAQNRYLKNTKAGETPVENVPVKNN
jgi:penicillin-binding protein 2